VDSLPRALPEPGQTLERGHVATGAKRQPTLSSKCHSTACSRNRYTITFLGHALNISFWMNASLSGVRDIILVKTLKNADFLDVAPCGLIIN
jgi:hypothetical protein